MKVAIKVLFIAGRIGIMNGAYHSLLSSVKELKRMGVKPIVLLHCHGPVEDGFREAGIECRVLHYQGCTVPANNPSKIKGIIKSIINFFIEPQVKRIIEDEKINIIHINASTTSLGARSALKTRTPLVWHLREFLEEDVNLTYINKKKTAILLNSANKVVAISDAVKDHFNKEYGITNSVTIYNGIEFKDTLDMKSFRKQSDFIFSLVGRIVPTKGQLEAVKALKEIVSKKYMNIKLFIIGDVGDDVYYKSLCNYIKENKLNNYVKIEGHHKNLTPIWKKTDIALICSTREGFGRVTAEFMMNGVPVIGANTGGTPELLRDGRGLIYSYGNKDDLAANMIFAYEHPEIAMNMAKKSKEYAKKFFTAQKCAEDIYQVYEEILTK